MLALCAVLSSFLLAPRAATAAMISVLPETVCAPTAGDCKIPDGFNGYVQLNKSAQVSSGGKDIYIVRSVIHLPLAQCGKRVQKAELKITKDSVQNLSKERIRTEPFPSDILLEHIVAADYPHDAYGTGNYAACARAEWDAKATGAPIVLVKGGTNLANMPISADVTAMVNDDLSAGRKSAAFRLRAVNSRGDGYFAYLDDPVLEIQKAEADMTADEKLQAASKPVALQTPLESLWTSKESFSLIAGQEVDVALPAVPARPGKYPVIRFQTRLVSPTRSGWNTYLSLFVNGEPISAVDKYSVSRVMNRADIFTAKTWGTQMLTSGNQWQTFFTPDYVMDDDVSVTDPTQYREGCWYLLRLDDVLKKDAPNTLKLGDTAKAQYFGKNDPKEVVVEVASLELGYIAQNSLESRLAEQKVSLKFTPKSTVQAKEYAVSVNYAGGLCLKAGKEQFWIDARFSYPNAGFNGAPAEEGKAEGEAGWKPVVSVAGKMITVSAEGGSYAWKRTLDCGDHFIAVRDTFTNKTKEVVGIIVQNRCVSEDIPLKLRVGGMPASPQFGSAPTVAPDNSTLFMGLNACGIGLYVADTPFRNQLLIEVKANQALLGTNQFGLAPGDSYTLRWSIYPTPDNDYFTFINRLRADLGVNYTIPGPFKFFYDIRDAYRTLTPDELQKYIARQYATIGALDPWFLYYNTPGWTMDQWVEKMKGDVANLRKGLPKEVKLVPCFEICLQPILKDSDWKAYPTADGFVVKEDGKFHEIAEYSHDVKYTNVLSYVVPGSAYFKKIMLGVQRSLDEIGFNGIYFDIFASTGVKTYDRWDGRTVEIDPKSYTVKRKLGLVPILDAPAKKEIVEYILKKGGIVVANQYPVTEELQSLPIYSFYEMGVNTVDINRGHLSTPIGLCESWYNPRVTGADMVAAVIGRLQEGGLMYYYHSLLVDSDIETYDLVRHMFPITIQELHPGWIKGKERTLTCKPGSYRLDGAAKPVALVFDAKGKKQTDQPPMQQAGGGWTVDLTKLPPGSIAVIEQQ